MNWFLLSIALCVILIYPIVNNEKDRYTRALHDCMEGYIKNEHTLSKDVCADIEERERCSESIRQSCLIAERENRVSPQDCARQRWFSESEVVMLYFRVAGSTWMLLVLLCVVIWGGMYFLVQYKTSENSHKRMVDNFGDIFRRTMVVPSLEGRRRFRDDYD